MFFFVKQIPEDCCIPLGDMSTETRQNKTIFSALFLWEMPREIFSVVLGKVGCVSR
jgi:hypothetical protein